MRVRQNMVAVQLEHSSGERFQYTERDLLVRLTEQVKALTDEMRRSTSAIASDVRDHEARLRILENFRWYIIGAAAAAASGFLGAWFGRSLGH